MFHQLIKLSLELIDSSNNTYKVTLNVSHQFRSGDSADIILRI